MNKFLIALVLLIGGVGHSFTKKVPTSSSSSSSSVFDDITNVDNSDSSVNAKYLPLSSTCYRSIPNQGKIKTEVLNNIIDFVRSAPDQVFERNNERDIYWLFASKVGPFTSLKQRRAVMADTEIILGGLESSWRYGLGRDPATSASKPCDEWEAGMFQTSSNTLINYGKGKLSALFNAACGAYKSLGTCQAFQKCSKEEPAFAHAYTGFLLRFTTRHHGPILNGYVTPLLSKSCEKEIENIL